MAIEQLNHHNPEYVTWKHEELMFALLGGIRIEGLHSMRVTLKVDFKTFPSIRHGLDLYNETQTDKLIKNIAERFTLSTTYIHKAVGNLINTVPFRVRLPADITAANLLKEVHAANARIRPSTTKAERCQTQRTTHPFYVAGVRHRHTFTTDA